MKTDTIKKICVFLSTILVLACTELITPVESPDNALMGGTKGTAPMTYYWYHGKMIDLVYNTNYVNVHLDTTVVKRSEVPVLCKELDIAAITELDEDGLFKAELTNSYDYYGAVEKLRKDVRILQVLPFFERGEDVEPIGTSYLFYVQLKEIVPEGFTAKEVPYLEKVFDFDALVEESERLGVRIVEQIPYMPDWYIMTIEDSPFNTSIDAANRFYETGRFEEIDPAFMFNFQPSTVNDPLFGYQWGLKNTSNPGYDINVESAWAISTMGANRTIAVVDQRVDPYHYDLSSNLYSVSYDAKLGSESLNPILAGDDHGTHVAGIIAAAGNNGYLTAGVAYNSKILRVYHNLITSSTISCELAQGINWAWQHEADVINNSWGDQGGTTTQMHSTVLESAIVDAMVYGRDGLGSTVVFAAGNQGANGAMIDYPASFDDRVLAVGSIGSSGSRSSFSSYGPELDILAPGEEIWSSLPGYILAGTLSGTSMAAPHISGVVALMLSANSYLLREEIVRIIQQTANKISPGGIYSYSPRNSSFSDETWNQEVGCGLVDAGKAVAIASALATPANPSFDPGINITYPIDLTIDQHEGTITGGYFPKTISASLLPANVNSAYSYYWYVTSPAHPYWDPALSYISGSSVMINVPNPGSYSTMYIRCLVYNGSTLVATPSFTLHVNP